LMKQRPDVIKQVKKGWVFVVHNDTVNCAASYT
jgi:hypothetical protein